MLRIILLLAFFILNSIVSARLIFAEDIRDVKPPVIFPINYSFFIGILIAVIIVLLFIWFQSKLKNKQRKISVISPPRLPWEIAYESLEELKQENLPQQGEVKEYYSRLSEIIRHYIEDRFTIRAPEMTTEEFLWQLKTSSKLSQSQKDSLKKFLQCSDMVKFAKHVTTHEEMDKSFVLAKKLIDETKEQRTIDNVEHTV